jgi:hypothetical protein
LALYTPCTKGLKYMKKLGFGMMRLPKLPGGAEKDVDKAKTADMIDCFLSKGFTYFDTAFGYHNGESEKTAGELLVGRYPRDKFRLATKMPVMEMKIKEDADRIFNVQLERTKAKYFDNYLLHGLNLGTATRAEELGVWDYLKAKKEQGIIRHLGFSFHSTAEHLEKIFTAHPEAEFVQIWGQPGPVVVVGDHPRPGCQRCLHPRLAGQAPLDGLLGEQPGADHHRRVRGVGARGDGRDDHVPMVDRRLDIVVEAHLHRIGRPVVLLAAPARQGGAVGFPIVVDRDRIAGGE